MKNINWLMLLLPLFLVNCNQQEKMILVKKRIKSTQQTEYQIFDYFLGYSKGERVRLTGFGKDYIDKFDTAGNLIETYGSANALEFKYVLKFKTEFNSTNKPLVHNQYKDDNTIFSSTTYKYDKQNQLIEEEYIVAKNRAGFISSFTTYKYKENECIKYDFVFDSIQGNYIFNHKEFIKKDKNGNNIETLYQDKDDKYYLQEHKKYDKNNNCIKTTVNERRFGADENYSYDDIYNEKNDIISSTYKKNNIEITTKYQYKYDKYGNWTVKKVINQEGDGSYFERLISYY